ncbi:Predicted mitochondrial cholesterol transporter [Phaffia rhodozyma]|uniref:Predicted mitochondrial cholesterol transporter n=1 Tax=Phaffia rhodozyma TaxID=264483 RepID=A0A0F7SV00_PHARH|nr:Predicted mitochondrial cholesterol transporter [Phaffia rhodozyma]
MGFLWVLTACTCLVTALFCLFALGAGLLWLADMLEHNPKASRRWGRTLTYTVISAHVLLYLVDSYPLKLILLSIVAHLVYLRIITLIPTPSLASPGITLILGVILLPVTHLSWYYHFLEAQSKELKIRPVYGKAARLERAAEVRYDGLERFTFYVVAVWAVPFFVFLSLNSTPGGANPITSKEPSSSAFTLPPPSKSILSSFLSRFFPRKYFERELDPTEGLLSPHSGLDPNNQASLSSSQQPSSPRSSLQSTSYRKPPSFLSASSSPMTASVSQPTAGGSNSASHVTQRMYAPRGFDAGNPSSTLSPRFKTGVLYDPNEEVRAEDEQEGIRSGAGGGGTLLRRTASATGIAQMSYPTNSMEGGSSSSSGPGFPSGGRFGTPMRSATLMGTFPRASENI